MHFCYNCILDQVIFFHFATEVTQGHNLLEALLEPENRFLSSRFYSCVRIYNLKSFSQFCFAYDLVLLPLERKH